MEQSKKKGSRVSKSRNACNRAKIAGHKEQMTLKQLSDAFGSVTMTEAASSSSEPDPEMAVEILELDQGQSGYNTDKATSGTNLITFDLSGQIVIKGMKILKDHLHFGAVMQTVRSFRVIVGRGSYGSDDSKLKSAITNLLQKEGIQFSEENNADGGTMIMIRLNGQTDFSFLHSDSDDDSD